MCTQICMTLLWMVGTDDSAVGKTNLENLDYMPFTTEEKKCLNKPTLLQGPYTYCVLMPYARYGRIIEVHAHARFSPSPSDPSWPSSAKQKYHPHNLGLDFFELLSQNGIEYPGVILHVGKDPPLIIEVQGESGKPARSLLRINLVSTFPFLPHFPQNHGSDQHTVVRQVLLSNSERLRFII